jgi:hypothetical protein
MCYSKVFPLDVAISSGDIFAISGPLSSILKLDSSDLFSSMFFCDWMALSCLLGRPLGDLVGIFVLPFSFCSLRCLTFFLL